MQNVGPMHSKIQFIPKTKGILTHNANKLNTTPFHISPLKICFVHTPMCAVENKAKDKFWRNFDIRYYMMHPESKPVDASIWELPHWVPWLAGVIRDHGFNQVTAMPINPSVPIDEGIDYLKLRQIICDNPADVYLHSPMTANLHFAHEISKQIKSIYPNAINIYGGVVATPLAKEIVTQHPSVDFVIVDRGECALPDILRYIEGRIPIDQVGHLVYHDKNINQPIHTTLKYSAVTPAELSFPYHDIYPSEIGNRLRYIRLVYGLGCPFKCHFCTIGTIGQPTEYFPIERLLAELDAYRSHYGKNHIIYFGDETFTVNKKMTHQLCLALQERGDVIYNAQTRLGSMYNRELMDDLYKSGCRWLEVGIESIDQTVSNQLKQKTNLSQMRDKLLMARDAGIPICSYIIHGLPTQTIDDMLRSADAVAELIAEGLLHATYYNMLVPYPGTKMYNNPEEFDMRIETRETKLYNEDGMPVYSTKHASSAQIYDAFIQATNVLADAMSFRPYLGTELSSEVKILCGASSAHN